MSEAWSQPVVIDTRAGASGIIGTEIAMNAPADGYTLLHANMSQWATNFGLEAVSSTPARFAEVIRAEAAKFSKIIKATGAKVE